MYLHFLALDVFLIEGDTLLTMFLVSLLIDLYL